MWWLSLLLLVSIAIWINPSSQSVVVGENDATFLCYGDGSYLYWFVDGVNTENMTSGEIAERGISFGGFYNYYPQDFYYCYLQHSYLTMAGNCLNNNTQIYCVILGTEPPPDGGNTTSNTATLTVEGTQQLIKCFFLNL